jgi:hypothetical protein
MLTSECEGVRDVALSLPRVLGAGVSSRPSRQISTLMSAPR